MVSLRRLSWATCTRRAPFLVGSFVFIFAMLALSLRPGNPMPSLLGACLALVDTLFLLVFVRMAYGLGKRPHDVARQASIVMVQVAAVTAAVSLLIFYWLPGRVFPASRLENLFVYLGLAPVLTGILYGFAGLAAAILAMDESKPRKRIYLLSMEALLLFAALCSHTRGAVLALAVGFGALPQVDRLAARGQPQHQPQPQLQPSPSQSQPSNPMASMVARKDAGRLDLYRKVLGRMTPPGDYLMGRGRWADDVVKPPEIYWHAHHPHSIYLATFYRGGAVAVALLGVVVFMGVSSGWREARRGRPLWFALAAYGLAAFLFDGDDLMTMASMPRIEPLLFWFPLAAGAGAALRQNRATSS